MANPHFSPRSVTRAFRDMQIKASTATTDEGIVDTMSRKEERARLEMLGNGGSQ